ncbi:MAG: hypothetical protein JSS83_12225 [Cyanobacteria bacterium SZAS LIN-3]|nr:hypothetical protein [Cyanobacteria bacterium SZAS LIN-3]MBS2008750.1 hypothetical protein [Cyanobacteria bacterium SZAS TMP-1]
MFNKPDPNELIFPGSPGEAALHQNVEMLGLMVISAALFLGYWLGAKGPTTSKSSKIWAIVGVALASIFAGTLLGIQGGILIVFWAGIGLGGGFFLGNRSYKRSHPDK